MRTWALTLTTAMVVGGSSDGWAGQKPDPTPNWRCQIVFRDAAGDAIKSDTTPGSSSWPKPYRDGVDGVTCYVVNDGHHDRWLYMIIEGSRRSPSPRFLQFIGQEYPQEAGGNASYSTFRNGSTGSFEVKGLANVEWNPADPTRRDVMPFRALLSDTQFPYGARMDGDSNTVGSYGFEPTSSVFVQPLDECSWQVTSYTTEEPELFIGAFGERLYTRTSPRVMRITKNTGKNLPQVVVGDFPMAFQATISIIGNKPGCPLP